MRLGTTLIFVFLSVVLNQMPVSWAVTEPVCAYRNSQHKTIFLKYFPCMKRGEDYVDFGADGRCLRRATCTETYNTHIEECKKFSVTCRNKHSHRGVFPACCVKC